MSSRYLPCRRAFLLVSLICLLPCLVSADEYISFAQKPLNVRKVPSSESPKIAKLAKYQRVVETKREGAWSKIKYNGKTGWVLNFYLVMEARVNTPKMEEEKKQRKKKKQYSKEETKDCPSRLERTAKTMMDIRYNYASWYIDPAVWRGFTLGDKEDLIEWLSYCRWVVKGNRWVEIKDGHSYETLGTITVESGPKIYK